MRGIIESFTKEVSDSEYISKYKELVSAGEVSVNKSEGEMYRVRIGYGPGLTTSNQSDKVFINSYSYSNEIYIYKKVVVEKVNIIKRFFRKNLTKKVTDVYFSMIEYDVESISSWTERNYDVQCHPFLSVKEEGIIKEGFPNNWKLPVILSEKKEELIFGVRKSGKIYIYRITSQFGLQIIEFKSGS